MVESDICKNKELNEKADNIINYEESIPVVKENETIIKFKEKGILSCVYRQGIMLGKFKQSENFVEMLKQIRVSKSMVYFKAK